MRKGSILLLVPSLLVAALLTASCAVNPADETANGKSMTAPSISADAVGSYNYGEALQKAIMFYEFQRSGKLPANTRNNWRGDSGLTDGSDVGKDLTGGWYDAGDHVKFNLPMSYTATMLAWSVYENPAAYQSSGQMPWILENIKWATDYLIRCHTGPNEYYYQVGDGGKDHSWWGPAEVMQMARPSFKVTTAAPGSTVVAGTSAALAAAAVIFKASDPAYAATCLQHAKDLFTFADATRSDSGYTAASGFYNSWSGWWDELTMAAIWIYLATSDSAWLTKAESYVANWGTEPQTTTIAYKWGHCWDDQHYGAELLLAKLTGKAIYKSAIEMNLDFWTTGYGANRITYTPKGLAWLSQWGSLRYATTQAFLANVYANWAGADAAKASTYKSFAKAQADYALGSTGRSFVIGYGENFPKRPHHRTAHSSWADSQTVPNYHRHTLVGALVGGPSASDSYNDAIDDYVANEVATDYNAGFVGLLAQLYGEYGGAPIANYKAIETKSNEEFYVEAAVNASGPNFVEIKALMINKSGWPARMGDKLSFKYFLDISEFVAKGYTADDFTMIANYNQGGAKVSPKLIAWDASKNIYYVLVDFAGAKIYPGGQSAYKCEIQFRMSAPQNANFWDNSNDWSYKTINTTPGGGTVQTPYIPVYDNGVLVYGSAPDGNPVSSVSSSVISSSSSIPSSKSSSSIISSSSSSKISSSSSSKSSSSSIIVISSSSSSTSVTRQAVPGKIEAESYNAMSGIQTESCSEGTLNVGWIDTGDWVDYYVNVAASGVYSVSYRVANQFDTGKIDFVLDGTTLASSTVPNTGAWQTWTSISTTVNLTAGPHTIRLLASGSPWNLNYFTLSTTASSSSSSVISSSSKSSIRSSSSVSSVASSSSKSSSSSVSSSSSSSNSQYVDKTAPFAFDGTGEYYWRMSEIPNYINCWNLEILDINGVSFLNLYASASSLPAKQNGYYYIHYKGPYGWSHFEAK